LAHPSWPLPYRALLSVKFHPSLLCCPFVRQHTLLLCCCVSGHLSAVLLEKIHSTKQGCWCDLIVFCCTPVKCALPLASENSMRGVHTSRIHLGALLEQYGACKACAPPSAPSSDRVDYHSNSMVRSFSPGCTLAGPAACSHKPPIAAALMICTISSSVI